MTAPHDGQRSTRSDDMDLEKVVCFRVRTTLFIVAASLALPVAAVEAPGVSDANGQRTEEYSAGETTPVTQTAVPVGAARMAESATDSFESGDGRIAGLAASTTQADERPAQKPAADTTSATAQVEETPEGKRGVVVANDSTQDYKSRGEECNSGSTADGTQAAAVPAGESFIRVAAIAQTSDTPAMERAAEAAAEVVPAAANASGERSTVETAGSRQTAHAPVEDHIATRSAQVAQAGELQSGGRAVVVTRTDDTPSAERAAGTGATDVVQANKPAATERGVDAGGLQLAQFQLPPQPSPGESPSAAAERRERVLRGVLEYQYALGSESDITYRRNPDMNSRVQDNSILLGPQINGYITYRPTNWLEMTLEAILEREIVAQEEKVLVLPSGDTRIAQKRRTQLAIDQAFVTFKYSPFDLSLGRKNFEDDRHFIYDTSLDVVLVKYSEGVFQAEASLSRKDKWDLDLFKNVVPGKIDNYMLHMTFRGIEDLKLNGYFIKRHDRARIKTDGKPRLFGVSAQGNPTRELSYWVEHAYVRGTDENRQKLSGYAYDVGGTYRFLNVPLRPNVTLGVAIGSGDGNASDNTNNAFRQTGLQSNEARYAGVSKFKTYGEVLDPELSNLSIYTAAVGFLPAAGITADLVFHRYRLRKLGVTEDIRNSPITAQLNQIPGRETRDVGKELDLVLGFRQLFGIRRLGLDLRMGMLFPGKAFLRNEGTNRRPIFREGDRSYAMVAKFWYSF